MKTLTTIGLLVVLLTIQASAQKPEEKRRKLGPPFEGRPQTVLLMAKVRPEFARELETTLRSEILPILARSPRVISVRTYSNILGGDFTHVVLLQLRPNVPLSFDTARDLVSVGRSPTDGLAVLDRLAKLFKDHSASVVLHRPDLSISRDVAGHLRSAAK